MRGFSIATMRKALAGVSVTIVLMFAWGAHVGAPVSAGPTTASGTVAASDPTPTADTGPDSCVEDEANGDNNDVDPTCAPSPSPTATPAPTPTADTGPDSCVEDEANGDNNDVDPTCAPSPSPTAAPTPTPTPTPEVVATPTPTPQGSVLGTVSTPTPAPVAGGVQGVTVTIPNTGGDAPLGVAGVLVGSGVLLVAIARRRLTR